MDGFWGSWKGVKSWEGWGGGVLEGSWKGIKSWNGWVGGVGGVLEGHKVIEWLGCAGLGWGVLEGPRALEWGVGRSWQLMEARNPTPDVCEELQAVRPAGEHGGDGKVSGGGAVGGDGGRYGVLMWGADMGDMG